MRYPSFYVLVTDMDDTPSNLAQNPSKAAGLSSDEPSMSTIFSTFICIVITLL